MAWITADDVAAFAPWFAPSADTTPTTTQISTQIDFVEGEVKGALRVGGWSTTITAAGDLLYVQRAALYGVVAWIVEGKQTRGRPGAEGSDDNRENYAAKYAAMLKSLRTEPVLSSDSAVTGAPTVTEGLKSYWSETSDDVPGKWIDVDGKTSGAGEW